MHIDFAILTVALLSASGLAIDGEGTCSKNVYPPLRSSSFPGAFQDPLFVRKCDLRLSISCRLQDIENVPPLHAAAMSNDVVGIRDLLRQGMDGSPLLPNSPWTPLLLAAFRGSTAAAKVLLQEGQADPNLSDGKGWTALHHAVALRNDVLVAALIARGANINSRDCSGLSPL